MNFLPNFLVQWVLPNTIPLDHKVLTYVEYRAVSCVFQNIDPPPPSPQRRGYTLAGRRGGQYFGRRQPQDWPLTIISLRTRHNTAAWPPQGLTDALAHTVTVFVRRDGYVPTPHPSSRSTYGPHTILQQSLHYFTLQMGDKTDPVTKYLCRGPEFKSRVWSLIFFHDDILGSLGSNQIFIILFEILLEYHEWLWKYIKEIWERVLANSFPGIHNSKIIS